MQTHEVIITLCIEVMPLLAIGNTIVAVCATPCNCRKRGVCLCAPLLSHTNDILLYRAKSKNGGHHLRQRLEAKGLSLPAGRRKQTELFLLTSLVEGEAVHLAEDFKRLCENYFPHTELAQIIGALHINSPHEERRISMVQAAQ